MNGKLKIDYDPQIMASLDSLVHFGYLTTQEEERCLLTNCVTAELLEVVKQRIAFFLKVKIDMLHIKKKILLIELVN